MNPTAKDYWRGEYSLETSASPATIWRLFRDVPTWKNWNAGIEHIEIHGDFAVGTEFVMTPPGQPPLLSRLTEVRENECFTDETHVDDLIVTVSHRIEPLSPNRTRITYAIKALGPDCTQIGPAIASDFPEVLTTLAKLAESNMP